MSLNNDEVKNEIQNTLNRWKVNPSVKVQMRKRIREHVKAIHGMRGDATKFKKYFQQVRNETISCCHATKMMAFTKARGELELLRKVFRNVYPRISNSYKINTDSKVFNYHIEKISKDIREMQRIQNRITLLSKKIVRRKGGRQVLTGLGAEKGRSLRDSKKLLRTMKNRAGVRSWNLQNKNETIEYNVNRLVRQSTNSRVNRNKLKRKLTGLEQRIKSRLKNLGKNE
jgi:hypothetical protein